MLVQRAQPHHHTMGPERDQRTRIGSLIHNGDERPAMPRVEPCVWQGRQYFLLNGYMAYPFPRDENEDNRLDILHKVIHEIALRDRMFQSDLRPRNRRQRALDVGYGTGIWCDDMAKTHTDFDVIGIDLVTRQLPGDGAIPNVQFHAPVDFNARDWPYQPSSFDLIRNCGLAGSIPDWAAHWAKVFRYLRTGGFAEYIEFDWTLRSDQGHPSYPEIHPVQDWWHRIHKAGFRNGRPTAYPENTRDLLRGAGFTDITHTVVEISARRTGREGSREWNLSEWTRQAMFLAEDQSLEGIGLWLLDQQGDRPDDVRKMSSEVRRIINSTKLPLFYQLHIWTARKP